MKVFFLFMYTLRQHCGFQYKYCIILSYIFQVALCSIDTVVPTVDGL